MQQRRKSTPLNRLTYYFMLKTNARFMKKWSTVIWKSSLGMSVIPYCSFLELNDGLQQYYTPETGSCWGLFFVWVFFWFVCLGFSLLEQEVELKRIEMNYEKLHF